MDQEYIEALKGLRERILSLRAEKANLLSKLENLEADGEMEVDILEKEIEVLQSTIEEKKRKKTQEIVFSF